MTKFLILEVFFFIFFLNPTFKIGMSGLPRFTFLLNFLKNPSIMPLGVFLVFIFFFLFFLRKQGFMVHLLVAMSMVTIL